MSTRKRRLLGGLAVLSAATVLQTGLIPQGCGQFALQTAVGLFDACSVFNCTSGTFFNFCEPTRLLVDCPVVTTTP